MDLNLNEKFNIVALKQDKNIKIALDKIYEHKWSLSLGILGLTAISKPTPINLNSFEKVKELFNMPVSTITHFNSTFGFNVNAWYLIGGTLFFLGGSTLAYQITQNEKLKEMFNGKLSTVLLAGGLLAVIVITLS